jgi:predicted dithiol-disulfide oxidoreductase (DUF899 family)
MSSFHDKTFLGESSAYRAARNELLAAEIDLRNNIERVANLRRGLPEGGEITEDYVFQENAGGGVSDVRLSELFEPGKSSLVVYSFMYAPAGEQPCPMCVALLDSLNGAARHIRDRVNLVVVAKAPVAKLADWAWARGWHDLRFLSSGSNAYNIDYFAEDDVGAQWPCLNVFTKAADGGVRHFYAAELFFTGSPDGMHARHVDMIWPLWNVFDLTPEGRSAEWFPKLEY